MPQVEAPFIIAVIREKEKHLLGDNEITRIMHAVSVADAREVLMSTPYAMFLTEDISVRSGLTNALEAEFQWLSEHIDAPDVVAFIGARYDVLHVAQALLALAGGQVHAVLASTLGTLRHEQIHEMVFTEEHTETKETKFWARHIRAQKEAMQEARWSMPFLFESMQHALEDRLQELAKTNFTKALALHVKSRHISDRVFRGDTARTDATLYEWEWDAKAITLARTLRFEPIGYDPIIAYWITKEMEVKTINLMFAGLTGGFSKEEIAALMRPLAHV